MKKLLLLFVIISVIVFALAFSASATDAPAVPMEGSDGNASWSLTEDGVLTITANGESYFTASSEAYIKGIDPYRYLVKHIEIDEFDGFIQFDVGDACVYGSGGNLCVQMPNLESVHFVADEQYIAVKSPVKVYSGLFANSPKLTTV